MRSSEATPAAPPALGAGGASADDHARNSAAAVGTTGRAGSDAARPKRSTDASVAKAERRVELGAAPGRRQRAPAPPERREDRVAHESEGALAKMAPPARHPRRLPRGAHACTTLRAGAGDG